MEQGAASSTIDYDGAWKEALDEYLEPFLRLCFPIVHAGIDWQQGAIPLDQELQEVVRDAEAGKRRVDKLFRVYRRNGTEEWLLVHLEVQSQPDWNLPERMYRYHHRLAVDFRRELIEYEAQKHMPYITSIERLGRKEGRQEGRQEGWREGVVATRQRAVFDALEIRFGPVPEGLRQTIETIQDQAQVPPEQTAPDVIDIQSRYPSLSKSPRSPTHRHRGRFRNGRADRSRARTCHHRC